jgi:hypothetical protein
MAGTISVGYKQVILGGVLGLILPIIVGLVAYGEGKGKTEVSMRILDTKIIAFEKELLALEPLKIDVRELAIKQGQLQKVQEDHSIWMLSMAESQTQLKSESIHVAEALTYVRATQSQIVDLGNKLQVAVAKLEAITQIQLDRNTP